MTLKFISKRLLVLLLIGLIFLGGFLWYKEQTTNKEAPKRAKFVNLILKENKKYG